jgi:membrane associated rhomboid family serine protease
MVVFYGAGGIVAALGHFLSDPTSITPVIGASGAVAAVMGAYFVWWPRALVTTLVFFFPVRIPAFVFLGIWFVLQFVSNPDSGVATIAHIAGFAFGAVVALVFRGLFTQRQQTRVARFDDPWGPYRMR